MLRLLLPVSPWTALAGAAAFFAATIYLLFERCSGGCTGFLEGMDRSPGLSSTGAVILVVVFALAFVGRRGRGVTAGFIAAFLGTAVSTSGADLFLWGLSPSGTPVIRSRDPVAERILELRRTGVDQSNGGRLAYRVLDCLADRTPSAADEISAKCDDLRPLREGYSGPERFLAADTGWRWTYSKSEDGFRVVVYPDAMLTSTYPRFEFDQMRRPIMIGDGSGPAEYPRPR